MDELVREEERIILEVIGEGLVVLDSQCRVMAINSRAAAILEVNADRILGDFLPESLLVEEDKGFFVSLDGYLKKTLFVNPVEMKSTLFVVKQNKTKFQTDFLAKPAIVVGKVGGAVLIFPDIRREKEIERMKTEFLSVVAHQLRSPLGSLRWGIEMLMAGDTGPISNEAKETLEQMYESNQWMITLVNDLLNVSRIEQGRVQDQPEMIDYLKIIKMSIGDLAFEAKKHGVNVKLEVNESEITKILLDPRRFRDVIENLVSNAIKYSHPQGVVGVKVNQAEKLIHISVSDQGLGIPEENKSMIYSKFFRAGNAIRSQAEGTGLGLFVVKSYVASWGGSIWFDSQEGKGTTFYVEIPIERR